MYKTIVCVEPQIYTYWIGKQSAGTSSMTQLPVPQYAYIYRIYLPAKLFPSQDISYTRDISPPGMMLVKHNMAQTNNMTISGPNGAADIFPTTILTVVFSV